MFFGREVEGAKEGKDRKTDEVAADGVFALVAGANSFIRETIKKSGQNETKRYYRTDAIISLGRGPDPEWNRY